MPRERCFPTICSSFVPLTLTVSATLRLFILNKATVAFKYAFSYFRPVSKDLPCSAGSSPLIISVLLFCGRNDSAWLKMLQYLE